MKGKRITVISALIFLLLAVWCLPAAELGERGAEELAEALAASPFASAQAMSGSGLKDASVVGVDREKFLNECLYPCVSDEDADHVIDVTHFTYNGVTYSAMGSDGKNDIVPVQMAIEYAKSLPGEDVKKIKLPGGNLDFIEGGNPVEGRVAIAIYNAKNIQIEGQDTTLYLHGEMNTLWIHESEDIRMQGVNIDWSRTPYSMAKVVSCDTEKRTVKVRVNSGYPIDEYVIIRQYLEYSADGSVRANANLLYESDIQSVYVDGQTVTLTFTKAINFVPKDTPVVLAHYSYDFESIGIRNSKNVYFEDVDSWSSAGFVVEGKYSENLYFNRFDIERRPGTDRLYTGTSDGIHTNECFGDIRITNSLMENSHDDCINICGIYMGLTSINKSEKTLAINSITADFPPREGDEIEIYNKITFEYVGNLKITSIERVANGKYTATYTGDDSFEFTGDEIFCDATRTAKVKISNCIFRNKRNRGIIVQFRDSEISNCAFVNICHGSIMIYTVAGGFNESLPSRNNVIKNCKFINNNSLHGLDGDIHATAYVFSQWPAGDVYVYSDWTIENNFFANTARGAMYLSNFKDSVIRNNLFYNMALDSNNQGQYNCAVALINTTNVTVENNHNINSANDSFKGIFMDASGTLEDATHISGNTGYMDSSVIVSAPAVTYEVGRIGFDVTVDGNLSDWTGGTEIEMQAISDVQGGDVTNDLARKEHFNVNYLKVGYTDEGIYFAFDVLDDEMIWLNTEWFTVDYVEVFLSTNTSSKNPMSAVKVDSDYTCLQYAMVSDEQGGGRIIVDRTGEDVLTSANKPVTKIKIKPDERGYFGEGFIPWAMTENLLAAREEGAELALTFVFSDIATDRLRAQASTATHPVESNKYVPLRMSKFRFV
ncbi:MAG: hypothetical protein IJF71_05190 [Clostridia bacterium]|nr:hypothetical protein [Clostridia bacterium]